MKFKVTNTKEKCENCGADILIEKSHEYEVWWERIYCEAGCWETLVPRDKNGVNLGAVDNPLARNSQTN